MKILRSLHLYLGCVFAPLLIFFAASGMAQLFQDEIARAAPASIKSAVALLSTLHTGRPLKLGGDLSSDWMRIFVVAMAASLILTIILGVVMAFRFGHRRIAIVCLLLGFFFPLAVCLLTMTPNRKPPNKAPEPTTLLVTPRAGARVAPSRVVAHL